jgi:serine/threonine-protein kinase
MEGDAAGLHGPLPQLVAAMCRSRLGKTDEAKRAMARAVLAFDWSARRAHSADQWTYHVLGREAEAIVVPELAAFLEGRYQPRDAHERLAMAGACQYRELHVAHSRLWADAFASDPALAVAGRYYAVGAATAAGCGLGNDAAKLTEAERESWRARARDWMGQELTAAAAAFAGSPQAVPLVRARLENWTIAPEMAGVRDDAALSRLPAAERDEWVALWQRVDAVRQRTRAPNPTPGGTGAAHGGTAR